jgi:purine-cytosine permease-like protein
MLAGILVSVPFWNQTLWHGPVVDALPQLGDLSFLVGFVVAAGVYYALAGRRAEASMPARPA